MPSLGPRRLPGAGRAMGRGLREFKNAIAPRADGADLLGPDEAG